MDHRSKCRITHFLEETIGEYPCDLEYIKAFVDMTLKAQLKNDKFNLKWKTAHHQIQH